MVPSTPVRWFTILALVVACQHTPRSDGPIVTIELRADPTGPLIVGLHGMGDSAQHFARVLADYPDHAEIVLAQGPVPYEGGWAWFDWPRGTSDDDLAQRIAGAEATVWPVLEQLAHGRKIVLVGFSQGAVMTYALAAHHPDAIAYAFPIAGRLPASLVHGRGAPVYALHGTADPIVDIDYARAAIAALRAAGTTAELHEFAGAGHTVAPAMRDDVFAHLRAAGFAQTQPASHDR